MTDSNLPLLPYQSYDEQPQARQNPTQTTTPKGQSEIKWKVVAETSGIIPAKIIAGRLQSEGIPTHAWQEGAGQAIGLIVGKLGTGYVAVPEEYETAALEILEEDEADIHDEEDDL
jgi:hypothetical protein